MLTPSRNLSRLNFTFFFSTLLLPAILNGQQVPGGGSIAGHVRGPGGVSVPGATIILTEKQSGGRKETWSDEDGNYAFTGMAPGTYKLTISLLGFQDDVRDP